MCGYLRPVDEVVLEHRQERGQDGGGQHQDRAEQAQERTDVEHHDRLQEEERGGEDRGDGGELVHRERTDPEAGGAQAAAGEQGERGHRDEDPDADEEEGRAVPEVAVEHQTVDVGQERPDEQEQHTSAEDQLAEGEGTEDRLTGTGGSTGCAPGPRSRTGRGGSGGGR